MKTLGTVTLLVAGVLLAAAPAAGQTAPMAPVQINACAPLLNPNAAPSTAPSFMGIPIGAVTSTSTGMRIDFVNTSDKVAKLVNIAVDSNGNEFIIRDVGTFSPNVEINHQYRNGAGQGFILPAFIAPHVTCRIASVEFADGTLWRHGQAPNVVPLIPPSPAVSGLSVAPAQLALNTHSESALFLVQSSARVANLKETDNCDGIASVFVAAVADRGASYYVRPIAAGTCAAHVIDENGATASIPITVRG